MRREGRAPTVREIAAHFRIASPKGVSDHLAALERKGYLQRDPGRARNIRLTRPPDAIPIVELAPDDASYSGSQITEVAKYVGSKGGLSPEEASSWAGDLRALASRGEYCFALNRYLFSAKKPG